MDEAINSKTPHYVTSVCAAKVRRADAFILVIGNGTCTKTVFVGRRAHCRGTRLKLGLMVSPRTNPSLHATESSATRRAVDAIVDDVPAQPCGRDLACDFFVVVTATFQRLYVSVLLDIATRRILHWNVTAHPTADGRSSSSGTVFRLDAAYRFVVHDRDAIFAPVVDDAVRSMLLAVLRTPLRAPQANAYCERFIGTARRDCLDWIIPMNGIFGTSWPSGWRTTTPNGHIPHWYRVARQPGGPRPPHWTGARARLARRFEQRLGGLHHHYGLERAA